MFWKVLRLLPLDLQSSLKVFDCLTEKGTFFLEKALITVPISTTKFNFKLESWKVQREFSHHFACLHVASIVSDVS